MGKKHANRELRKQAELLIETAVNPALNARLDAVDSYCRNTLEQSEKRAKAIQSWIIGEVKNTIQGMIHENGITLQATLEVLAEAGLVNNELLSKVEDQKLLVRARLQKEAEDRQQAARDEAQKRADAEAAAKTNVSAPDETPAQVNPPATEG